MPQSGALLGKITEQHGFVPSPKNTLGLAARTRPRVDIKTFGLYALFDTLVKDEIPSLKAVFGEERVEALLTFAMGLSGTRLLRRALGARHPAFGQIPDRSAAVHGGEPGTGMFLDAGPGALGK
jgi:hypothetical protein